MTAIELLDNLRRSGVELQIAGDRLRYRPAAAVGPELRRAMREHKAELLDLLGGTTIGPDDLPGDWRIDFEERAAIMEYEGGLTREHAEAKALEIILRRMRDAGITIQHGGCCGP